MLQMQNVCLLTDAYRKIKDLQKRAFPESEQFNLFFLWILSLGSRADMKAV